MVEEELTATNPAMMRRWLKAEKNSIPTAWRVEVEMVRVEDVDDGGGAPEQL